MRLHVGVEGVGRPRSLQIAENSKLDKVTRHRGNLIKKSSKFEAHNVNCELMRELARALHANARTTCTCQILRNLEHTNDTRRDLITQGLYMKTSFY